MQDSGWSSGLESVSVFRFADSIAAFPAVIGGEEEPRRLSFSLSITALTSAGVTAHVPVLSVIRFADSIAAFPAVIEEEEPRRWSFSLSITALRSAGVTAHILVLPFLCLSYPLKVRTVLGQSRRCCMVSLSITHACCRSRLKSRGSCTRILSI